MVANFFCQIFDVIVTLFVALTVNIGFRIALKSFPACSEWHKEIIFRCILSFQFSVKNFWFTHTTNIRQCFLSSVTVHFKLVVYPFKKQHRNDVLLVF
ncbi:MAG: hypothetical protein BWX77_00124 [Bacteroidetes bacterium ADurb.Bin090]|nr:MAG: hypothetical protein BWX77_00124 [Bacteroidetes bacterium ADurb.Bin090]